MNLLYELSETIIVGVILFAAIALVFFANWLRNRWINTMDNSALVTEWDYQPGFLYISHPLFTV